MAVPASLKNRSLAKSRPCLLLASASPARLDLLKQAGITAERVVPSHIEEYILRGERPRVYAGRMAREKAAVVALRYPDDCILAADTVVACGRRILPKAATAEEARSCLSLLSGRAHRVYTGLCVRLGERECHRTVMTRVTFKRLMQTEIDAYLESAEWKDKAGGYAVQGQAGAFIQSVNGSYSSVVGLPLYETVALLRGMGWPFYTSTPPLC